MKNIAIFHLKIFSFYIREILHILHRRVCIMLFWCLASFQYTPKLTEFDATKDRYDHCFISVVR